MGERSQIAMMLNSVPDAELPRVKEIIKCFIPQDADDVETPEDTAAHIAGIKEYEAGETIPHSAINWD